MIAKISGGKDTAGLIRYLYGPGRANEHTDPHLVASFDGFAPDPGRAEDPIAARRLLAADLDLRVKQAERLDRAPAKHVWHCSVRAAPEDRTLTDEEWATVARRVLAASGIAPEDDPDGCRWIAVRHAEDHIHIVATTMRGDLRPPRHWNDYHRAMGALTAIETDLGLHQVRRGADAIPASRRPSRAEQEKAARTGRTTTVREQLRHTARTALAHSHTVDEYLHLLTEAGLQVETRTLPSGDLAGYKLALPGDTNTDGVPVWFAGSKLATDLSLPKIQQRLAATDPTEPAAHTARTPRWVNPWHQATAAIERIPHHLDHADDTTAHAHLAALGEALYALPALAPAHLATDLRQAALAFENATHARRRVEYTHARALRTAIKAMPYHPAPADGSGLAMLLDAAILAVIAIRRWHQLHYHDQHLTAARQTLEHLEAAYQHAAAAPLAVLTTRAPIPPVVERHARAVHTHIPDQARAILDDPAWSALATALTDAETAGHDPARLLQHAANQRALDDATSPARVLTWRIHRLSHRHAPSARARAALARTTTMATATHTPAGPTSLRRSDPTESRARRR